MSQPIRPGIEITEIDAGQTHALRQAVLRDGTPSGIVDFPEDHLPGTLHLGALVDGVLVGISTWIVRPLDGEAAVQLRGMATAGASQRRGIGSALIHEGVRRTVAAGYRVVWANARDSAAGFYARHGFVVLGDGFVTADTQLPHHLMVRRW